MSAAARYAKALFELAQQHKSLGAVAVPAQTLAEALGDPALKEALANPLLTPAQRAELAKAMARAVKAPALLANTLNLLAQNNRLALLPRVLSALQEMTDTASGTLRVTLATAEQFTAEQRKTLSDKLKSRTGAKTVELTETVKPDLIGGFTALFGGQVWDTSLSGRLARLKGRLAQAVQQKA